MVKWSRIKTLLILSLLFLYVTNVSARSAESISAVKYVLCSDHNVIERSFGKISWANITVRSPQ